MIDYPRSETADICLILEGTYPFVSGGVSNWVYELIRVFPEYRFAVIFLGTKAADYHGFVYPLLDNVVHLQAHYLFETNPIAHHAIDRITTESMSQVEVFHQKLKNCPANQPEIVDDLLRLMENQEMNESFFSRSKQAWELIVKCYAESYADQSFFDYFWGVKNLHRPFWALSEIIHSIPKVKVLHSASTGYAGFLGALLQKKYNIPYVVTEHGLYTTRVSHFHKNTLKYAA